MSSIQSLPLQGPSFSHKRPSIFSLFPEYLDNGPKHVCEPTISEMESSQSGFDGSIDAPTTFDRKLLEDEYRVALRLRLRACASDTKGGSGSRVLSDTVISNIEFQTSEPRRRIFSSFRRQEQPSFYMLSPPPQIERSDIQSPTLSQKSSNSVFSPKNLSSKPGTMLTTAPAKNIYLPRPPSPVTHEWPTVAHFFTTALDPLSPNNWLIKSLPRKTRELWFYGVGRNTPTFLSPASSITSRDSASRKRQQTTFHSSTGTFSSLPQIPHSPRTTSPPPPSQKARIRSFVLPLTPLTLALHNAVSTLTHLPSLPTPYISFSPSYKTLLLLPLSTVLRAYDFWTPPKSATQWNTTMQRAAMAWGASWTDMTFNNDVQTTAQWLSGEICFGDWCCGACCRGGGY